MRTTERYIRFDWAIKGLLRQKANFGVHTGDQLQISTKEKDAIVGNLLTDIFSEHYLIRPYVFDKTPATPLEEWIEQTD